MSKTISDMTFTYLNPETGEPTVVPPNHYEKILDEITEKYMSDVTSWQMLAIMFNQLSSLRKENPDYFYKALVCMDLNVNVKDLRIADQVAILHTNDFITNKISNEKKDFHFLSKDIVDVFVETKNNPNLLAEAIRDSNEIKHRENKEYERYER